MNGKGDAPRNCFSENYKLNYEQINWAQKNKTKRSRDILSRGNRKQTNDRYGDRSETGKK